MNILGQLPSELITLILDRVDKKDLYPCALTNKLFYTTTIPLLWRHIDIDSNDTLQTITSLLASSSHHQGRHVRLVCTKFKLSDQELMAFLSLVPLLESLRLNKADHISDISFQHVPRLCPHLTTLSITGSQHITQTSMVALGQYCPRLCKMTFEFCHNLDSDLFDALHFCPLKDITITQCPLLGRIKNSQVAKETTLVMAQFQQLESLRILDYTNNYTVLLASNTVWPHLTHLSVGACDDLDDTKAIQFLQSHPRLIHLELSTSNYITDRTLDVIPTCLSVIREVVLHCIPRLTAEGICRLVKNCPTLEDGVRFPGCYIYPQQADFRYLDEHQYRTVLNPEIGVREVVWVQAHAFDNHL